MSLETIQIISAQELETKKSPKSKLNGSATLSISEPISQRTNNGVKFLYDYYFKLNERKDVVFKKKEGLGYFASLSDRLMTKTLVWLNEKDILTLACASREFSLMLENDEFWQKYARKRLDKGNLFFRGTWRASVLERNRKNVQIHKRTKPPTYIRDTPSRLYKRQFQNWFYSNLHLSYFLTPYNDIERRSAKTLTVTEFFEEYEKKNKPFILTDAMEAWGCSKWTNETFVQEFSDVVLRCGHGVRMSVKNYNQYMKNQSEASPLYLFDGKFAEKDQRLIDSFTIPEYFQEDLFSLLPEDDRPPYRWIILGPVRTGAAFHIDPYKTSAWNAVIFGSKQWCLFPPDSDPPGAGDPDSDYYEAPRPIKWYMKYYSACHPRPIECIQKAGEIIFVPSGWWHQVVNLEETFSVTQNVCNHGNLATVTNDMTKNPRIARIFKSCLEKHRPDLLENRTDLFVGLESLTSSSESSSDEDDNNNDNEHDDDDE